MSASSDRERVPQRQLGELMTGLGLITEEQLATVLEVQQRSKRPLGQIIVELGFASGAAVAHALAMQSGGALRTEYGFALGVHPDEESDADGDDETATGLPKLRLASGAVAPPVKETVPLVEESTTDDGTETEAVDEPAALAALPAPAAEPEAVVEAVEVEELEHLDEAEAVHEAEVDEIVEVEEPEPSEEVVEVEPADEELPVAEPVEVVPEDVETPVQEAILEEELEPVVEADAAELLQLRAQVERLETARAETEAAAARDQERLRADVAKLESLLAETHETNEKRLSELWEERDNATTEIERLQTTLADAQGEREQELTRLREEHEHATTELERLQATLAVTETAHEQELANLQAALTDTQTEREQELTRLREEHEHATAQLERLQATLAEAESAHEQEQASLQAAVAEAQAAAAAHEHRLAEEQERHAGERDELAAQRDRLEQELGHTLERLATLGPAAEERDRLRGEIEQLEATFAEARTTAAAEQQRLLGDIDRLESALAETQGAQKQELAGLRQERDHAAGEVERLQGAVAETQTAAAEHERRLAEEHERHSVERDELTGLRDRLQAELGDAFERLATLGPAVDERDELRAELERVHAANAETREECAVELRELAAERDSAQAELAEAKEMLVQAERVRESQIALTAERDRAFAELEQLRAVAAEAQAEAEERSHLLAEEQDRHLAERESLLAQRKLLEHELGDAIERLAAAASTADRHEEQLQLAAARLRALAADLVSDGQELPEEPEAENEAELPETETGVTEVSDEPGRASAATPTTLAASAEADPLDYALFVPGPNGYELVPQTGVPPQAGETVEVVPPDGDEPALYEVARCARTLPGGGLCVYLAPR